MGVYAFRRATLARYAALEPTPLEVREGLEQLRLLEHGVRIRVVAAAMTHVGVDVPSDCEVVARLLRERLQDHGVLRV